MIEITSRTLFEFKEQLKGGIKYKDDEDFCQIFNMKMRKVNPPLCHLT